MRHYHGFIADSDRWHNFRMRDDDVVITTPSKSGTTWMQTIVGMLLRQTTDLPPISTISPWIDMQIRTEEELFRVLDAQTARRFVKTHTPFDGLPYNPNVTYIAVIRHPLDVALSDRDHGLNMKRDETVALREAVAGKFEKPAEWEDPPDETAPFLRWFIDNTRPPTGSGPNGLDDYCQQIRTYWEARDKPNVHLFHYADMWHDLDGEMRRVAAALGIVILLAGARAAWITFALVLLWSGWRLLGWKKLLGVFAFGAVMLALFALASPQVRERVERTTHMLTASEEGVDSALSGRARIWGAAACMARHHPVNGVGARGFREAFDACDPERGEVAAWGEGPALHAHQLVLEVLSETGGFGLLLWLAGAALAWRAWRYASEAARARARPAMVALAVTVFPFNTHLAFYSTFWGGLTLLLAALYAGSLLGRDEA